MVTEKKMHFLHFHFFCLREYEKTLKKEETFTLTPRQIIDKQISEAAAQAKLKYYLFYFIHHRVDAV